MGHLLSELLIASLCLLVIEGHILGSGSTQLVRHLFGVVELLAGPVQLRMPPLPAEPHVGRVPVEQLRGQHIGSVHGDALALMHGTGIAMIEVVVVAGVEGHLATIVEAHRHRVSPDGLDGPERAVLHFDAAVVLQEVQPVSGSEISSPARCLDPMVDAELVLLLAVLSGELVELLHFVAAIGQHDLRLFGLALAALLPGLHDSRDGLVLRFVAMHMSMHIVLPQRRQRLAAGQLLRRFALPVDLLTPNFAQLVRADMLPDSSQGRARVDGLKLLGVSDEHHLGAGVLDVLHHPLHLPGADHAGLVDDEHVSIGQLIATALPCVLPARQGPGDNS